MKQVHLLISGFVQGVGYRYFVKRQAEELGVTGYVQNLPDRRVEIVAQSSTGSDRMDEEKLKKLVEMCEKGPMLAEVKNISVKWEKPSLTLTTFEIKSM